MASKGLAGTTEKKKENECNLTTEVMLENGSAPASCLPRNPATNRLNAFCKNIDGTLHAIQKMLVY